MGFTRVFGSLSINRLMSSMQQTLKVCQGKNQKGKKKIKTPAAKQDPQLL